MSGLNTSQYINTSILKSFVDGLSEFQHMEYSYEQIHKRLFFQNNHSAFVIIDFFVQ